MTQKTKFEDLDASEQDAAIDRLRAVVTALRFNLTITLDGAHAADVADDLAIDADAGELDQGVLDLLRAHLVDHGDTRDWRIVTAAVTVADGEVTP